MKWVWLFSMLHAASLSSAQPVPPPAKCGWFVKDLLGLEQSYNTHLKYIEIRKGEKIASVGAQAGNLEVLLSLYTDSIEWTLEDIDTSCLNQQMADRVLQYNLQLANKTINSSFRLVLGTETQTNLPDHYYDRVLLLNTYHEMSDQKPMLADIHRALKPGGRLVVNEKMGSKPGKKRRDCNHIMPFEPDFLQEMTKAHFILVSKYTVPGTRGLSYFVFESM